MQVRNISTCQNNLSTREIETPGTLRPRGNSNFVDFNLTNVSHKQERACVEK